MEKQQPGVVWKEMHNTKLFNFLTSKDLTSVSQCLLYLNRRIL
jgi:hypothetical protein